MPRARIFRDVESIGMGDWRKSIGLGLRISDVVLVVIGERWLSVTQDRNDKRRLDDPEDMVRWEVTNALSFKADRDSVAQVLLDDVSPPPKSSLPVDLQRLFDMQAYRLRYEDWDANVTKLVEHLRRIPVNRKKKLKGTEILERWNKGRDCPEWVGCGGGESVFLGMKVADWLNRDFEVEYMGDKKNNNWFRVSVLARSAEPSDPG